MVVVRKSLYEYKFISALTDFQIYNILCGVSNVIYLFFILLVDFNSVGQIFFSLFNLQSCLHIKLQYDFIFSLKKIDVTKIIAFTLGLVFQ